MQNDSTRWIGVLALPKGQVWDDVRFIVQVVNGVGLVTLVTNFGDYFIPGIDPGLTPTSAQATTMTLISPPTSGPYGTLAEFTAQLDGPAEGGSGIPNQVVEFAWLTAPPDRDRRQRPGQCGLPADRGS